MHELAGLRTSKKHGSPTASEMQPDSDAKPRSPDMVIALFEPEIPPNTGSIMRIAANTGARLALIEPLSFEMTDTRLRRAGLDYRDLATTTVYTDFDAFLRAVEGRRLLAFSTRGTRRYDLVDYLPDDALLFGPESRGLPDELLAGHNPAHAPPTHSDAPRVAEPEPRQRGPCPWSSTRHGDNWALTARRAEMGNLVDEAVGWPFLALRGIRVASKDELRERLERYIDELNAEPVVFKWTYGIDDAIRV